MTTKAVTLLLSSFLIAAAVATTGCKKPAHGACEVTFDGLGNKGEACTVVTEAECKDDVSPPVDQFASSKRKTFTEGAACAAVGYKKTCPKSPIAWTFKSACP